MSDDRTPPRSAARSIRGARVLELGGLVAGPLGSLILANLGAEVIKVESFLGDPSRPRSNNFVAGNRGKKSIALDLKRPEAQEIWLNLVRQSDAVLQNLGDGATASLGVSYEDCRKVNPDIAYCRIRGFGPGPYEGLPATNPIVEALTGLMSITTAKGKPARQGMPFYDQLAGMLAALGVVSALAEPDRRDGRGYVEVDLFETALFSVGPRLAAYGLEGELAGEVWGTAPYDVFRTSDERWVFVGVLTDALWRRFCTAFGLDGPAGDDRFATANQRLACKDEVDAIAQLAVGAMTLVDVLELLRGHGIPCSEVNDFAQVLADEHVRSPGKLEEVDWDGRRIRLPSFPIRGGIVTDTPLSTPPQLGQDSDTILGQLGYDPATIMDLVESKAVRL